MGKHTEPRAPRDPGARENEVPMPSGPDIMAKLGEMASKMDKVDLDNLDASDVTARIDAPGSQPMSAAAHEEQDDVMSRVSAFLNPKTAGPIYRIPIRGKVFVGRLLTAQEALEVERRAGLVAGRDVSIGQILTAWINELLGGSFGYVKQGSPEEQVLAAHINDPERWPKLKPITWLESRDPYLRGEEIEPLWLAYSAWKTQVTPTADDIRFYFSRVE